MAYMDMNSQTVELVCKLVFQLMRHLLFDGPGYNLIKLSGYTHKLSIWQIEYQQKIKEQTFSMVLLQKATIHLTLGWQSKWRVINTGG